MRIYFNNFESYSIFTSIAFSNELYSPGYSVDHSKYLLSPSLLPISKYHDPSFQKKSSINNFSNRFYIFEIFQSIIQHKQLQLTNTISTYQQNLSPLYICSVAILQNISMQQKILKIHPLSQHITINEIAQIMKNFTISQINTQKDSAFVKFQHFDHDVSERLEKQFPNGRYQVEGQVIQLSLMQPTQQQTELDQKPSISKSYSLEEKSLQPKLVQRRSLQRKHTVEINLPSNISDPSGLQFCLKNNVKWANQMIANEPEYFKKLINIQRPKYLWIGCADSRVPANQIVGLKPGQLFVHRNVANIVSPSDINALAVIQYAVQYLEVEDIIVTGHYGCGGVKASFSKTDYGLLQAWLANLRQIRARYNDILDTFEGEADRVNKLVELNVQSQVLNLSRIPIIQKTWKNGKKLRLHGLVYRLQDGILHDLKVSMDSIEHIPQEYRIVQ